MQTNGKLIHRLLLVDASGPVSPGNQTACAACNAMEQMPAASSTSIFFGALPMAIAIIKERIDSRK